MRSASSMSSAARARAPTRPRRPPIPSSAGRPSARRPPAAPTEVRALTAVSLDIAAGEFVSIMGPSGSGKSTLLHLMGGLDVPTAGEIVIEGTPISRMSDDEITIFRRRKIGFVFQFFNLLP